MAGLLFAEMEKVSTLIVKNSLVELLGSDGA
jgi:hypothetical protein